MVQIFGNAVGWTANAAKLSSVGLWLNASKSESMLACDDIHLDRCFVSSDSLRVNIKNYQHCPLKRQVWWSLIFNVGQVKSFVDDLNKERGTVSMRVAFVLRSAEVQPLFRLICALALVVPIVVLQTALADSPPPPAIRLRPPSLTWPTNNPHPHSQHGESYGTTPNSLSGYETSSPKPCSRSCWPLWSVNFRVNLTINIFILSSYTIPSLSLYMSWLNIFRVLPLSGQNFASFSSRLVPIFHHVHIIEWCYILSS